MELYEPHVETSLSVGSVNGVSLKFINVVPGDPAGKTVKNVSMSTSNISKSVLSTPRTPKENESSEIMNCQLTPVLARFKVEQAVDEARNEVRFCYT